MPELEGPFDLSAMSDALRRGDVAESVLSRWLNATWTHPGQFAEALQRAVASKRWGVKKGGAESGVDVYFDCITSHIDQGRVAFVASASGQTSQLTYDELDRRASSLVAVWSRSGTKAGASIAIVLPVGVEYAVALAAALRAGLSITTIAPLGASHVRAEVALADADFVATSGQFRALLPELEVPVLPVASPGNAPPPGAVQFAPDDPVLRLVSPFGEPPEEPYEVNGEVIAVALARDALLTLGLLPGDRVAAPGLDVACLQPITLMTTWYAGACWVELSEQEIERNPKRLDELGVTVLGVSRAVRDRLSVGAIDSVRSVHTCFRLLNDVFDFEAWHRFARLAAGGKVNTMALLTNSASGGVHLFSPRSSEPVSMRAWPAPGRTWQLQMPVGDGVALNGTGVYTALSRAKREKDASLPRAMLAESGRSWAFGGCIDVGPQARRLPLRSIEAVACLCEPVGAASVFLAPGRFANDARVVLLLFVDEPVRERSDLTFGVDIAAVRERIAEELGRAVVPDVVEVVPLCPRFDGPVTDTRWCKRQYLSGSLAAKARMPLFRRLARLEWMFDTRAAVGAAAD